MSMPIFIINLEKDTERKKFMSKQLDKLGLNYEFITGFLGDSEEVIKNTNDDLSIKYNNAVLTKGEKGCAYSHRHIYQKIINENIPYALIMEDDAILPDNFKEILEKELNRKNKTWEWLSFEYPMGTFFLKRWFIASTKQIKESPIRISYLFLKFIYVFILFIFEGLRNSLAKNFKFLSGPKVFLRPLYHASNYLISKEGAEKLISLSNTIIFSADRLPNQARIKRGLILRGYAPLIAKQDKSFESRVV